MVDRSGREVRGFRFGSGSDEWSISRIMGANAAAGWYFFSRDTLRFFRSRIGSVVGIGAGCSYFTTTEQYGEHNPRSASLRCFIWATGDINTVGAPGGWRTSGGAVAAGRRAAALSNEVCRPVWGRDWEKAVKEGAEVLS